VYELTLYIRSADEGYEGVVEYTVCIYIPYER